MKLWDAILDLLYPPKCAFCGKILPNHRHGACEKCLDALEFTPTGGVKRGDFYTSCVSPLWYENEVRDSILRYKFYGCAVYSGVYGQILATRIEAEFAGKYDLLSWVPLHRRRERMRGYDQSHLLAEEAGSRLGMPAVRLLEKHRATKQQSRLARPEQRRANISGAYRLHGSAELLRGKRVLLIDDILTTGATLSECSRVLRSAGAAEVLCATLARTRK